MNTLQIMSAFGFPTVFSAALLWIVGRLKAYKEETRAVQVGIQALLRDRLLQSYNYHSARGYAGFDARENFENMYLQYHCLGANGVMDDIRARFLALPLEPPKE